MATRHWKSLVLYQENLVTHAAETADGIAECDQFKDWLCGNQQSCCTNLPAGSSCPVGQEMGGPVKHLTTFRSLSLLVLLGNSAP